MVSMQNSFKNLMETIKTLREPGGCPWDIDQTPMSMRHDLLEECFEAIDAITQNDSAHAKEELGDLLFNTLVMCYMYEQNGDFTIADVFGDINAKLIRRHPHVFPQSEGKSQMEKKPLDATEVLKNWDKIKENVEGRKSDSVLDSIPENFSVLQKSFKMLKKASKRQFEWSNIDEAKSKVLEEFEEIQDAKNEVENAKKSPEDKAFTKKGGNPEFDKAQSHLEEEVGDFLLAAVNYARWLSVDPEIALDRANRKFKSRFQFVEHSMAEKNILMDEEHQKEMLGFWNEAKADTTPVPPAQV